MNETKVVHFDDGFDVDISRSGKWGNPFRIGVSGTRKEVIEKYEAYLRSNEELMSSLHELEGKRLGCHCFPKSCHGDVLVKLIKEQKFRIC